MTLSVFAGSFDLTAADRMCTAGDALDLLTRLAERSMLTVRRDVGGGARYELLETLRDYGRRRLGDEQAAELYTAHASHFASEAAIVARDLHGPAEVFGVERAESSFADLRSAQRFALDVGAWDDAFGIIASLREFAMRAMRYEVFAWADAAFRVAGGLEHPRAPVLIGMHAYGAWVRGEFDLAVELATQTRRLEETLDTPPSGLAERVLGNVLYIVGRSDEGNRESARQLELAEESGDKSRLVHACYMAAVALSSVGEYAEAAALVRRAHAEAARDLLAHRSGVGRGSGRLFGRPADAALEAFVNAERLARSAGNRWMSAFARTEASGLLVHRGDIDEGCAGLAETVGLWYRAGEWSQQWHTLSRCMFALHRIGQTELAVELLGAIEAHAMLAVAPMSSTLHDIVLATRDAMVEELGTDRADEMRSTGGSRPVEDIVPHPHGAVGPARLKIAAEHDSSLRCGGDDRE